MTPDGQSIIASLQSVAVERQRRQEDPSLEARVRAVKSYQHARFESSYADLLAQPRYAAATRFFLDDLYGPRDFSERDVQFIRIVPALVRLFPQPIVRTVRTLSELHALSETLDTRMAEQLTQPGLRAEDYKRAWRAASQPAEREHQIELMLSVGEALERYTRNLILSQSLRLMRGPARAAGLGELQRFLETGFDTFRAMRGAKEFLATIALRERLLADSLFAADIGGVTSTETGEPTV